METNHEDMELDHAVGAALGVEDGPAELRDAKTTRALRETVARLAAASPHMKPPEQLRSRILQATATKTYKLEDYRKVSREDYRWYKWGFYAAAVFLILGAMYNYDIAGKLQIERANVSALQGEAKHYADASEQGIGAIRALVSPGMQITYNDSKTGKPFGRVVANGGSAVMIFPSELLSPDAKPQQLSLKLDDGKILTFNTVLYTAPASSLGLTLPTNATQVSQELATMFNSPQQLAPGGEPGTPRTASVQLP